jgi:hypothetical protein
VSASGGSGFSGGGCPRRRRRRIMVTGIRGDGGQLGTGTPGNSSGRREVGRTGRSELVHMCSFSISAPSTARRTESAGRYAPNVLLLGQWAFTFSNDHGRDLRAPVLAASAVTRLSPPGRGPRSRRVEDPLVPWRGLAGFRCWR